MSPTLQLNTHTAAPFVPTSDSLDRHEFGVTKSRKMASTGGGRAWSEDEEVYLLQTRLQKMPYKHIAAHLKKTELACRLHYHQISHGSNRRKRTASTSSSSSTGHSPTMLAAVPSPIREHEASPAGSSPSYSSESPDRRSSMQLPSIMSGIDSSPRLPAILPKPASMSLGSATGPMNRGYTTPLAEPSRALAPSPFPQASPISTSPSLRLDCSLPQPGGHVDMGRLHAVYAQHRSSFWGAIASEYGGGVSPVVLEQAWKTNTPTLPNPTPISPATTPNERDVAAQEKQDRTRISAILGIDANPRSPKEREMVRRLEQERNAVVAATA
jgi:hypothetical protein